MSDNLTMQQIEESIGHLTSAHEHLDKVRVMMNGKAMVIWIMGLDCDTAWTCCNMARVHTEKVSQIEEALIPAMGNIMEGRCMFDHLNDTGLGMTDSAQRCIVEVLRNAQIVLSGIIKDLDARLCFDCAEELDEETAIFLREFEF